MTRRPPTTEIRIVLRTILSAGVLAVLLACTGAAATWVVDDDGGADFTSIQVAVDAAGEGDTIEVRSGTYIENVDVNKRLTLIGEGADVVTVRAASSNDHVFDVTADLVNITGFTVTGATGDVKTGICLQAGTDHCNISYNKALNNHYGIYLLFSSNNTLIGNIAPYNTGHDIYLDHSSDNVLTENIVANIDWHGIRLAYSNNNTIIGNTASTNNGCAILLYASVDNRLINNDASNSFQGIFMYTSSNDNTVSGNTASGNRQGGIYLEGNNNTITGNTASNNGDFGIALESSSNNTLYHNNLDGNTNNNAYDDGTNQWDSGTEGNYYSDYTGTDSDGDGIGDTSYPIPGGSSVDRYPLMAPYTPAPTLTDLKIKSISTDPEILFVGEDLTVNIDVENVGQDINFTNHDISIRLIAGTKFGNHETLHEERYSDRLSIRAGTTQRISKTFLMDNVSNHELMFMVDAVEVEITSNDYTDNNPSNNKLIKNDLLTSISLDDSANCLMSGLLKVIHVGGLSLSKIKAFMISDPELKNLLGSYQGIAKEDPIDALDIYAKFIIRLINLISIDESPEFVCNFVKNVILGLFDFGKCSGYTIIQFTNIVYQIQEGISANIETNIFHVESPVDIEVIDDNSQHAGYVNGNVITDIEESYVKINGSKKSVIIFGELNSNYIVKLIGTADGTFSFYTYITKNNINIITEYRDIPVNTNSIGTLETKNSNLILNMDFDGSGVIDQMIPPNLVDIKGEELYNITFLPPITTKNQFNPIYGNTLSIKFTARDNDTGEFIHDDTVNVTITNSTGSVITNFNTTNGVQIDPAKEQYAVDFNTMDYPELTMGETYTIQVTFGGVNSLRGFAIAYFTLVDRPLASSTTPTGIPRYRYCTNENVYAAGSGFTPGTNADIHVVPDQDWDDGDPIPIDVTGAVETVSVNNGGIAPVLVWHAPLAPGSYDIVIDANQNGFYDAATDGLDSGSPGFIVVADATIPAGIPVPALTPHGIIALVGLLCVIGTFMIRRRFI